MGDVKFFLYYLNIEKVSWNVHMWNVQMDVVKNTMGQAENVGLSKEKRKEKIVIYILMIEVLQKHESL